MIFSLSFLPIVPWLLHTASASLPSYIKVCKRSDQNLDQCIINSINSLRPKMTQGIPELDVPPMDPLFFEEFAVSRGRNFKAIGKNVVIRGTSNYTITYLKSDIDKLTFQIGLRIPYLHIEADYDVDMSLMGVKLKGKGPLHSNNSDVTVQAVIKGHKIQKNKGTYLVYDFLELKINLKNYNVRLENLFGGDKALGDAVNIALEENKKEMMDLFRPMIEKMLAAKFLSISNKITKHITFDELFPEK